MKREMERRKDVNWSEVIRRAIREKLQFPEAFQRLEELVRDYVVAKDEVSLRVLHLRATLLSRWMITRNIEVMYGRDSLKKAEEALNRLDELGLLNRYYLSENISVSEAIETALFDQGVIDLFTEKLVRSIKSGSRELQDAVWIISQYESNHIVEDGLLRTFELAFGEKAKVIIEELMRIGLLYRDLYDSRAYTYYYYRIPDYAMDTLRDVHERPFEYNIYDKGYENLKRRIRELLEDKVFRGFLEWLGGRIKYVEAFREEEEARKFQQKYGVSFDEMVSQLVKDHVLIIDYSPHRRRVGRRKSWPAEYIYKLTPDAQKALMECLFERFLKTHQ